MMLTAKFCHFPLISPDIFITFIYDIVIYLDKYGVWRSCDSSVWLLKILAL